MKPLNLDNSPCSPVSSNCVIWQGPNIDCIDLCTGDSISTVVYKLATELCEIMNQLDLTNLDLACLKVGTNPPETFSELIQLLINKICNTPTGSNLPAAITDPCPTNCIVPIAECFQSGTQTTMLLLDYVQMIGEKVCSLVDQIGTINNNITNITNRVTELENKPEPEPYELPPILVECTLADTPALPAVPSAILAGNSYKLDVVLQALVNDDNHGYCALLSALGQPGNVTTAYQFQSTTVGNYIGTTGASASLANCGNPLQSEYTSWTATPLNLSDSFKNLWITVSDIRKAHKTYEVVAGNTSVNVATATTDTLCGKKDTVTVSANLPIVAPGDNITVTPTTSPANVTTYTIAGKETIVQQGANITVTSAPGPGTGDTTYTVATKGVTAVATSSITTTVDSTGPNHVVSARVNDTGWVDLLGFSWFVGSPNYKPQCRRIGNVIHFRGALMIPLQDASGNVINYTYGATDTYATSTRTSPFVGTGGVDVDDNGSIAFNNDNSVIPTSVCNTPFDTFISSNYITASRYFVFNNAGGTSSGDTGILHTVCKIFIFADGRIRLQLLYDNEYSPAGSASNPGSTSALNTLVSKVKAGDRSPRWYASPTLNTWAGDPNFHGSNTMSGSTQTISVVGGGGGTVTLNNYREMYFSDALRFPFDCDARLASQLGGFGWIQLEGLITTVAPCTTDIKTITCP